ncbi:MAG: hypothetical protein EXS31_12620 [Pedosphaera sp.]|nr:hypothetical protein [Pedosphaera sp.]
MNLNYLQNPIRFASRRAPMILAATVVFSTFANFASLKAETVKATKILIERVPNGGIQPQLFSDNHGTLHLVYFSGDPANGDLQYVRRDARMAEWSKPIRVNSQSGSAIAVGSIRGAQMAIGRNGRIHVAWNGSSEAPPATHVGAPMLYSRMNDAGTAFESERDIITKAAGLDGGGSVAADLRGNVYVVWHALIPGAGAGEGNRAVFLARSTNDGRDFTVERQISPADSGACGCCGLRAYSGDDGNLFVLFRGASEKLNRPMRLLTSRDGENFKSILSHPWQTPSCPMSSATFAQSGTRTVAAWESDQQVYWTTLKSSASSTETPRSTSGAAKSRHPAISVSSGGSTLVAWSEGTGWNRGGAFAWQLFDSTGKATDVKGRQDGVPVWSFAATVAKVDGSFLILH